MAEVKSAEQSGARYNDDTGELMPGSAPPPPPPRPVPAIPAGWHRDPKAKHELRYWDGSAWTAHVSNGGVQGTDALPQHSGL